MAWWLVTDPEFKARYHHVSTPRRDIGVDLCAHPHDGGKPTAVQCKQHAGEIPKRELDSFLSAAAMDDYADGLLIHTGTGFSENAGAAIDGQRARCGVVGLDRLRRSDVQWPPSIAALERGSPLKPRVPQEHQMAALDAIRFHLNRPGRTRTWVNMACGGGKTLVGVLAADEFAPELAIVLLADSTALHDTVKAWRRDAGLPFAELRLCATQERDDPDFEDLSPLSAAITTNPEAIAGFLASPGRRAVFCTYRSAHRLIEPLRLSETTADLIVCDDAHEIGLRRLSARATHVLDDKHLPARRRLFLTATPRIYESDAMRSAERRGSPLVDMRDSSRGDFGVRAYHLSYREAERRGIVLPFQIHVVQITTQEVERVVASRRLVAASEHTHPLLASLAATQIAVVKAVADLGLRRIVAFHSGVDESLLFAESFAASAQLVAPDEPPLVVARHVDSYNQARRKETVTWFERHEGPCVISNNKLLAVGVDRPAIDGIVFNDATAPAHQTIQAVGRALRRHGDKTKAIVVVPMVVGADGNVDKARARSSFSATLKVLEALRTIDPAFELTRESLRLYAATPRTGGVSRTASLVPVGERTPAPLEVTDTFAEAITHRVLPPSTSRTPAPRRTRDTARATPCSPTPRLRSTPRQPVANAPQRPRSSAFEGGIDRLEYASGDHFVFRLSHPDDAEWLSTLRQRFSAGSLAVDQLQRIADHLSFLADGLGPSHAELRSALAHHADRSVASQLAAWLHLDHRRASYLHQLSTIARDNAWPLEEVATRLHRSLTHPGIHPIERARLCLRPLLAAASGLGEHEDPMSRLEGLIASLTDPWAPAPPRSPQGWRPDAPTDAGRADWQTYEAGWHAGRPWRAQARLIAQLTPDAYARHVRRAADADWSRPPLQRWDHTQWIMFLDELNRSAGDMRAATNAARMRYRRRARRARQLIGIDPIRPAAAQAGTTSELQSA